MTLLTIIAAWIVVALAMLWGVLRISRRHHPVARPEIDMVRRNKNAHASTAS
ncbi:hypothetical protein [Pseudomonas baetica]|uniref:hypothetical protein n=1 Tax=Pseudomonas baetica TaxID=674054 RepID=UPI002870B7BC|nr:hypothetical protein [Pseudomonas baetica]MDR9862920.1 hypothetical protein [Pseudomonas baetica]